MYSRKARDLFQRGFDGATSASASRRKTWRSLSAALSGFRISGRSFSSASRGATLLPVARTCFDSGREPNRTPSSSYLVSRPTTKPIPAPMTAPAMAPTTNTGPAASAPTWAHPPP